MEDDDLEGKLQEKSETIQDSQSSIEIPRILYHGTTLEYTLERLAACDGSYKHISSPVYLIGHHHSAIHFGGWRNRSYFRGKGVPIILVIDKEKLTDSIYRISGEMVTTCLNAGSFIPYTDIYRMCKPDFSLEELPAIEYKLEKEVDELKSSSVEDVIKRLDQKIWWI